MNDRLSWRELEVILSDSYVYSGSSERLFVLSSAIRHCARHGWADGLRALAMKRGASNQFDESGWNAAHWAAWGGDLEAWLIVKERWGAAAVLEASRYEAWGGLHCAALGRGAPPLCYELMKSGLMPGSLDRWGLMAAHWSDDPAFWAWSLSALWAKGADPSGKVMGEWSHQDVARSMGHQNALNWMRWGLKSAEPESRGDALERAPWMEGKEMMRKRLESAHQEDKSLKALTRSKEFGEVIGAMRREHGKHES